MKIAIVMTEALIVRQLMKEQLNWIARLGFKVTVICNNSEDSNWIKNQGVKCIHLDFKRKISLFHDLKSLFKLILVLKKLKPNLIHYSTPKTSLLTPLAIKLGLIKCGVIYTIRGRVYENYNLLNMKIFEFFDFFSCLVADKVIFISKEMKRNYLERGVLPKYKALVLGNGSSNGFNIKNFRKPTYKEKIKSKKYFKLNNFSKIKVVSYVGRINKDKGINDLLNVYQKLLKKNSNIVLLIVGNLEMKINSLIKKKKLDKNRIIIKPWISDVRKAYWASDVLIFPSYREGFGNVCIESILCGVPVISYNVIGCRESVKHSVSGFLVPFKNEIKMCNKANILLKNKKLRMKISNIGAEWAKSNFSQTKIWNGIINIYKKYSK